MNETAARRSKRRMRGAQNVAIAASGVSSSGSGYDVKRESEIEMETEIQSRVYAGLTHANKLYSQASILATQEENKQFNMAFQRDDASSSGKLQAENIRWQAKVRDMGGTAQASSLKAQGNAQLLNGFMGAAQVLNNG